MWQFEFEFLAKFCTPLRTLATIHGRPIIRHKKLTQLSFLTNRFDQLSWIRVFTASLSTIMTHS